MVDDALQVGDRGTVEPVEPRLGARPPAPAARAAPTRAAAARRGSRRRARRRSRRAARTGGAGPGRCAGRRRAGSRARTRRCPRTASSTRPGRGRRRRSSTAWSAGCRRRSTSSRSRSRPSSRSPKSCDSSLTYGVSPQPAQAPENSNSGSRNWVPRTVPKSTRDAVGRRQRLEERDVLPLGGDERLARREVDRLAARDARRDDRAGLDAELAAGAVLDVDLQRVARVGQADGVERRRPEPVRGALEAATGRSTSSGSRCAGRRSCSCRTGCRGRSPRPRRARRCCASRRPPCRSDTCRRPAAR